MTRVFPIFVLCLSGCPFVFGPPDLVADSAATVPVPDADTDADADSDADADTDTDTGTGPGTGVGTGTGTGTPTGTTQTGTPTGTTTVDPVPEITAVIGTWHYDTFQVRVEISDADGDLVNGVLQVDDGVNPVSILSIPNDLAAWNPAGIATVSLPADVPCGGGSYSWTVRVTDFAGNQSSPEADLLQITGLDHLEVVDPLPFVPTLLPAVVCGNLSNNSDEDEVELTPPVGGPWTFTLHDLDTPPKARDLELRDGGDVVVATAVNAADPDSLNHVLNGNETYTFRVYAPGGGGGSDWMVAVHE